MCLLGLGEYSTVRWISLLYMHDSAVTAYVHTVSILVATDQVARSTVKWIHTAKRVSSFNAGNSLEWDDIIPGRLLGKSMIDAMR